MSNQFFYVKLFIKGGGWGLVDFTTTMRNRVNKRLGPESPKARVFLNSKSDQEILWKTCCEKLLGSVT